MGYFMEGKVSRLLLNVHEIGEMLKRDGTDTYFVTQTSEFLVL
jgi:hypothetical protein